MTTTDQARREQEHELLAQGFHEAIAFLRAKMQTPSEWLHRPAYQHSYDTLVAEAIRRGYGYELDHA